MGQLHKANKRLKSELTSEVVQKKVIAEKKVEQRISQVRDNAQFTEMKDIKVKRAAQLDDKERVLKAQQSTRLQLLVITHTYTHLHAAFSSFSFSFNDVR